MLYGLKQAATTFYKKLLVATRNIGLKRSTANPCINYKWEKGSLLIVTSWIDNNMILGPENSVMQVKADLMKKSNAMIVYIIRHKEYAGNKIEYIRSNSIALFRQCYY